MLKKTTTARANLIPTQKKTTLPPSTFRVIKALRPRHACLEAVGNRFGLCEVWDLVSRMELYIYVHIYIYMPVTILQSGSIPETNLRAAM